MTLRPALVVIDLGAESCRVSLLRWPESGPELTIVRRFANAPWDCGADGLRWNLDYICQELLAGLHRCAEIATESIASIGVTGWAVDYVRLGADSRPTAPPFCYRDPRTNAAFDTVHAALSAEELYAQTGVQIQPINTIYQLCADKLAGTPPAPWVNLPEYILHWLGAPRVAEFTNATHTALVSPPTRAWSDALFAHLGLRREDAPPLVASGTLLGSLRDDLRCLRAFGQTQLIAPACHDTASAVAGIPPSAGTWAYISSGTWSLVGMVLPETHCSPEACARGFTNLGAAGGGILFHRGLPGMWLLRQCLDAWKQDVSSSQPWRLDDLIAAARALPAPHALLDLDDPAFLPPGDMPARINTHLRSHGLAPLKEGCAAAPEFANLIFHSLAHRYAAALADIARITGRRAERICIVGGGSRHAWLNQLTAEAAGIPVECCSAESTTVGNLAVQLARLEQDTDGVTAEGVGFHARALANVPIRT